MPFQLNSNPSFPKVLSSLRPVNHALLWLLKVCRHIRATSGQVRCVLIVEKRKAEGSSISWVTRGVPNSMLLHWIWYTHFNVYVVTNVQPFWCISALKLLRYNCQTNTCVSYKTHYFRWHNLNVPVCQQATTDNNRNPFNIIQPWLIFLTRLHWMNVLLWISPLWTIKDSYLLQHINRILLWELHFFFHFYFLKKSPLLVGAQPILHYLLYL